MLQFVAWQELKEFLFKYFYVFLFFTLVIKIVNIERSVYSLVDISSIFTEKSVSEKFFLTTKDTDYYFETAVNTSTAAAALTAWVEFEACTAPVDEGTWPLDGRLEAAEPAECLCCPAGPCPDFDDTLLLFELRAAAAGGPLLLFDRWNLFAEGGLDGSDLAFATSPVDADVAEVAATLERGALDITLGLEGSLLSLLLTPKMWKNDDVRCRL